jgi:hypothetical protein
MTGYLHRPDLELDTCLTTNLVWKVALATIALKEAMILNHLIQYYRANLEAVANLGRVLILDSINFIDTLVLV